MSCNYFIAGCLTCNTNTTCTGCDIDGHFVLNGDTCDCITQYFKDQTKCTKCSDALKYCDTCADSKTCQTCQEGFDLDTDTNTCPGC